MNWICRFTKEPKLNIKCGQSFTRVFVVRAMVSYKKEKLNGWMREWVLSVRFQCFFNTTEKWMSSHKQTFSSKVIQAMHAKMKLATALPAANCQWYWHLLHAEAVYIPRCMCVCVVTSFKPFFLHPSTSFVHVNRICFLFHPCFSFASSLNITLIKSDTWQNNWDKTYHWNELISNWIKLDW